MLQKILGTVMRLSLLTTVFALALLWFGGNHLEQLYGWPSRSQIVTSCGAIIVAHAVLAIRAAMRARTRAQAIEPEVRAEPRVQAIVAPPPIPQDRPRDEPPIAAKAPPLAAHPDPLGNPQQIGSYRILDLLGEGGMGTVYLAEQREPIRRRVAIKVIKLGMDTKEVLRRFEAERQALAMLDHDNVARMLDAGATTEGRPWFAMELVAGISITEYCDQNRLPVHDRLALFCQVCSGIQHVHGRGILHRDLKPSNVLVADRDGHRVAKIIDFGLARAMNHRLIAQTLFTEQGVIIGTPEYMSPEQAGISGLDVDHRSDVYSLGALLYELLVGEPPFAGLRSKGLLELQRCVREEDPAKPSTRISTMGNARADVARRRGTDPGALLATLRQGLDRIVVKALRKDRMRRYQTAQALGEDIQQYLSGMPTGDPWPRRLLGRIDLPSLSRAKRLLRVRWLLVAALAIVLGGLGSWMQHRAQRRDLALSRHHDAQQMVETLAIDPNRSGPPPAATQQSLGELRDHYLTLDSSYSAMNLFGPSAAEVQAALDDYAICIRAAFLLPIAGYLRKQLEDFVKSEVDHSTLQKYSQLLLAYRSTDKDYQDPMLLGEAIKQQNLWKWSPAELGQATGTFATSEVSRHLATYLHARQRSDGWVVGYFFDLVAKVEEKLEAHGLIELMLSRRFETDDTLRRGTNAEIERELLRMREQTPGASQIPEEKWLQDALRFRKDSELRRVGNIGLLRTDSLNAIADSLTDLSKDASPHRAKFNESLANLRAAGVLERATIGRDAIADAFVNSLEAIAQMYAPVQDLFESAPLGQRIRQDLRDGSKRLDALGLKLAETRSKVGQKLEAVRKLSGLAAEPIRKSLFGMVDAVAEGVAREVRAEIQESWTKQVGTELAAMLDSFPWKKDTDQEISKSDFIEMFRPAGRIAKALQLLDQAHGLSQLQNRLVWSDRFEALRERMSKIQQALFDAAAPRTARLQFRVGRMEPLSINSLSPVQDVILRISTGNEVKLSEKSSAARLNELHSWNLGDVGGCIILELTLKGPDGYARCSIPHAFDPRALSEWGFLRVLRAASQVDEQDIPFTWRIPYQLPNDPRPYEASAAVVLRPVGKDNPFTLGFFDLQLPEWIFQADVKQ